MRLGRSVPRTLVQIIGRLQCDRRALREPACDNGTTEDAAISAKTWDERRARARFKRVRNACRPISFWRCHLANWSWKLEAGSVGSLPKQRS